MKNADELLFEFFPQLFVQLVKLCICSYLAESCCGIGVTIEYFKIMVRISAGRLDLRQNKLKNRDNCKNH